MAGGFSNFSFLYSIYFILLLLYKKVSGNTSDKFCGLGLEGFPYYLLRYRHLSRFRLKIISYCHQLRAQITTQSTLQSQKCLTNECSRSFPRHHISTVYPLLQYWFQLKKYPLTPLKESYSVYLLLHKQASQVYHNLPNCKHVSTVKGSTPICHYGSPLNLTP